MSEYKCTKCKDDKRRYIQAVHGGFWTDCDCMREEKECFKCLVLESSNQSLECSINILEKKLTIAENKKSEWLQFCDSTIRISSIICYYISNTNKSNIMVYFGDQRAEEQHKTEQEAQARFDEIDKLIRN